MLGDQPAVTVDVPCKFWEERVSSTKCETTPGSILGLPTALLGQKDSIIAPVITIAVWGGLAWFLFMRGK